MLWFLSIFSWVTVLLSILFSQLAEESIMPEYLLSIVILSLFPIFAKLYYSIIWDGPIAIGKKHLYIFRMLSILVSIFLVIFSGADTFTLISLIFFIFIVLGITDVRILFVIALVDIIAVMMFLLILKQEYADYFSLQAYYALFLGTIAFLIGDNLSNWLSTIIAPLNEPKWWKIYVWELQYFSSLMGTYLPFLVLLIILISYSPLASLIAFDERFLSSITLIMWALLPFSAPIKVIGKSTIIFIVCVTYFLMFETYIEGMIAIIFYLTILAVLEYRADHIMERLHKISQYFAYEWRK